jgi:hypothetical protein
MKIWTRNNIILLSVISIFLVSLIIYDRIAKQKHSRRMEEIKIQNIENEKREVKRKEFEASKRREEFYKSPAAKVKEGHPSWSFEECERLERKEIWIGMKIDMVKYLNGKPDKINVSDNGSGKRYQYVYRGKNPSYFYCNEEGRVESYN